MITLQVYLLKSYTYQTIFKLKLGMLLDNDVTAKYDVALLWGHNVLFTNFVSNFDHK